MSYPDCIAHHMPQRSDDWFSIRKGILTASNFGPWLTESPEVRLTIEEIKAILHDAGIAYGKKAKKPDLVALLPNASQYMSLTEKAAASREAAICKLIAERANCEAAPNFENWAMKRGAELEPQALAAFQEKTGFQVAEVGFCKSIHGAFGCSPDGLIYDLDSGFEGKVPVPETHLRYRRAGVLPDEYLWQVHGSMAVTGATSWWFQSWNPGLASLRVQVFRDDFTEQLKAALVEFSAQFEAAWYEESEAVRKEFA